MAKPESPNPSEAATDGDINAASGDRGTTEASRTSKTGFGPFSVQSFSEGRLQTISLHFPPWLVRSTWEFELRRWPDGGWQQLSFRCVNVRANGPIAFQYVRHGDLEGLLALFGKGAASPFDIDEQGWTLLHVGDPIARP